ncbi:P-loop containing nucleoside triphosphate hydrolase [Pseudocohnilembus persalinus]|uniref:p-loop containing nucleoside triphosphate hydrolase n=1 Tax=Pseudocohnilembus persalinus TaxID=266149 RepID=A0A0V0QF29_PSEPJ|nr:P-loop containing nucleoside triphosphate hydrolase [Pseudocohnilembus persalinus]|eukprot:KRX00736.1 P-loop containing nucleoside triphosphate hydrolase [Pseudocohnilembus persalinus]
MLGYGQKKSEQLQINQQQLNNNNNDMSFEEDYEQDILNIKKNQHNQQNNDGILLIALRDLFNAINAVYDLLQNPDQMHQPIQIGTNTKDNFYLKGIKQIAVSSKEEIFDVLQAGEINRHYASTKLNHKSSRSHTVFRITVQSLTSKLIKKYRKTQIGKNNVNNEELLQLVQEEARQESKSVKEKGALITESELNFVDLAGSEKVSNHEELIKEELNTQEQQQIVNQRVKEGSSLVGNSRNLILCCVSPSQVHFEQTLSTLRFGLNARQIENSVHVNIQAKSSEEALGILISGYEQRLKDLLETKEMDKQKIMFLKKQIRVLFDERQNFKHQKIQYEKDFENIKNNQQIKQYFLQNIMGPGVQQLPRQYGQNDDHQENNSNEYQSLFGNQNKEQQKQFNVPQTLQNLQYLYDEKQKKAKYKYPDLLEMKADNVAHLDDIGHVFLTNNNKVIDDKLKITKINWQELIFDSQGKYAYQAFLQAKNKSDNYQKGFYLLSEKSQEFVQIVQDQINLINQDQNKQNEDQLEQLDQLNEQYEQCMVEIKNQYQQQIKNIHSSYQQYLNELVTENKNQKMQIDLLCSFQGGNLLDKSELLELEEKLESVLKKVREERIKRIYEDQIITLQKQIGQSTTINGFVQEIEKLTEKHQIYVRQLEDQYEKYFNVGQKLNLQSVIVPENFDDFLNNIKTEHQNQQLNNQQAYENLLNYLQNHGQDMSQCKIMAENADKENKGYDLEQLKSDIISQIFQKNEEFIIDQAIDKQKIEKQQEFITKQLQQQFFQLKNFDQSSSNSLFQNKNHKNVDQTVDTSQNNISSKYKQNNNSSMSNFRVSQDYFNPSQNQSQQQFQLQNNQQAQQYQNQDSSVNITQMVQQLNDESQHDQSYLQEIQQYQQNLFNQKKNNDYILDNNFDEEMDYQQFDGSNKKSASKNAKQRSVSSYIGNNNYIGQSNTIDVTMHNKQQQQQQQNNKFMSNTIDNESLSMSQINLERSPLQVKNMNKMQDLNSSLSNKQQQLQIQELMRQSQNKQNFDQSHNQFSEYLEISNQKQKRLLNTAQQKSSFKNLFNINNNSQENLQNFSDQSSLRQKQSIKNLQIQNQNTLQDCMNNLINSSGNNIGQRKIQAQNTYQQNQNLLMSSPKNNNNSNKKLVNQYNNLKDQQNLLLKSSQQKNKNMNPNYLERNLSHNKNAINNSNNVQVFVQNKRYQNMNSSSKKQHQQQLSQQSIQKQFVNKSLELNHVPKTIGLNLQNLNFNQE